MFRCPVCTAPLEASARAYQCQAGHTFDRSREGYVNLLAGRGSAGGRERGDAPAMVRARREFLDAGYYEPLRRAVLDALGPGAVLDVGCGEGYYTRPLAEAARRWVGGIDVSKYAIRAAARRTPAIEYAVANAFALPVVSGSVDVAVNVFGPVAADEMARVLVDGGRALVVSPGPTHLIELKRLLFDEAAEHPLEPPRSIAPVLHPVDRQRLTFAMDIGSPHVEALVDMTPYRWQIPADRKPDLPRAEKLTVTADFLLFHLRT